MWLAILTLIIGFIALVWGADRFVSGAAATARNLGVSKIVIGVTAVSVGTSAPEILVALDASLRGTPQLAIGNAIGSNTCNIGIVLGITAMMRPLPFAGTVLKGEVPWMIGATLLALIVLLNGRLGFGDGLLLLAGLGFVMYRLASRGRAGGELPEGIEEELAELPEMGALRSVFWLLVGLVVLLVAADKIVEAAVDVAELLHVDEFTIGLTIVAVGTSLPELAATLAAAIKGQPDIAIGNIVGSNIINILAVMAVPALVAPSDIAPIALWRDFGMMLAMSTLLVLFAYGPGSRKLITRFEGAVLVCAWIGYTSLLYLQRHA